MMFKPEMAFCTTGLGVLNHHRLGSMIFLPDMAPCTWNLAISSHQRLVLVCVCIYRCVYICVCHLKSECRPNRAGAGGAVRMIHLYMVRAEDTI